PRNIGSKARFGKRRASKPRGQQRPESTADKFSFVTSVWVEGQGELCRCHLWRFAAASTKPRVHYSLDDSNTARRSGVSAIASLTTSDYLPLVRGPGMPGNRAHLRGYRAGGEKKQNRVRGRRGGRHEYQ